MLAVKYCLIISIVVKYLIFKILEVRKYFITLLAVLQCSRVSA